MKGIVSVLTLVLVLCIFSTMSEAAPVPVFSSVLNEFDQPGELAKDFNHPREAISKLSIEDDSVDAVRAAALDSLPLSQEKTQVAIRKILTQLKQRRIAQIHAE